MTQLTDVDRRQIIAVVRRADELATARDVDGYLALTTPDMILDGAQGDASGREAVRAAIASIWAAEPAGTEHHTSDVAITAGGDDYATARSTLSLAAGTPQQVWGTTAITQDLRKVGARWLIARRTVANS